MGVIVDQRRAHAAEIAVGAAAGKQRANAARTGSPSRPACIASETPVRSSGMPLRNANRAAAAGGQAWRRRHPNAVRRLVRMALDPHHRKNDHAGRLGTGPRNGRRRRAMPLGKSARSFPCPSSPGGAADTAGRTSGSVRRLRAGMVNAPLTRRTLTLSNDVAFPSLSPVQSWWSTSQNSAISNGLVALSQPDGVDIRPTLLRVMTDLYVQKPGTPPRKKPIHGTGAYA